MVGTLLFLKMLHCKRMRRGKTSCSDYDIQGGPSSDKREINVKREENYEEQTVCRVCLKEGNIPIFGRDGFNDISEDINNFGGIKVSPDDAYPKYLCQSCQSLLQGAILFRKTAQQSEKLLIQSPLDISRNDDSNNDVLNEDDEPWGESKSPLYSYEIEQEESVDVKEKGKNLHCNKCNLDFETFQEYQDHRVSEEHENMKVNCPVCNKAYNSSYLKKHLALHKLDMSYMCDVCGKKFVIQGQFARHRLTHFYNLPFKCSLCPYRGRFSESLKMHMRSHTGEKPYQCTECPSRYFVNKSNLNKHMLTHKNDYDFKCNQCQRGFYTKRNLDIHYKVDHSGIKDHVCNICGKAFGYRKQMMKHQLKVHKREKLRSGRMPLYLIVESKKQEEES